MVALLWVGIVKVVIVVVVVVVVVVVAELEALLGACGSSRNGEEEEEGVGLVNVSLGMCGIVFWALCSCGNSRRRVGFIGVIAVIEVLWWDSKDDVFDDVVDAKLIADRDQPRVYCQLVRYGTTNSISDAVFHPNFRAFIKVLRF